MDNFYLKVGFDVIHILATITWFGALFTNIVLVGPAARGAMDGKQLGEFMGRLMKRTKVVVYISFALLFITGIPMKISNANYVSIINFSNNWQIVTFIKHVSVALIGLLVLYNFEVHPRRLRKAIPVSSPEKIARLNKTRDTVGKLSMALAFIIILLSAMMRYVG